MNYMVEDIFELHSGLIKNTSKIKRTTTNR